MAGRIPQSFIDDLLDRVDIVELVDNRVKLKKSGKNYSACCPFHDEKTPSFTVTQDKQFYYCFGCGASGNAIGFLMEYDRMEFPEAVEQLARLAGVEVPREDTRASRQDMERQKQRKTLYSLLEQASEFYRQQLRHHPQRQRAVTYLQNRGFSGEIARDFAMGYAPPGWDNLLKALGSDDEQRRLLIESGMLVNRDDSRKLYDRFRDRILFPIRDTRGRVIGFGGRVLGDDKPKYLNSPESPVFHKGRELYGLYEARQKNNQLKRLLVVEGYMDVVALSQFGIHYAVATLGTACRTDHLHLAFKHTQEVVFCFDGDNAGRLAARRALEASLPVMTDGRQVKFLFLPEGEDPDTLVRQVGPDKFTGLIDRALPLEEFFFDLLTEDLDPRSMEGRARLSKLAAPQLNQLPKGVYRELMFSQLAQRTGLDVNTLLDLVEAVPLQPLAGPEELPAPEIDDKTPPAEYTTRFAADSAADTRPRQHTALQQSSRPAPSRIRLSSPRLLILLLLHYPSLAAETEAPEWLQEPSQDGDDPQLALFRDLLKLLHQRPHFTTGQIIGYLQGSRGGDEVLPLNDIAEQQSELIRRIQQIPDYDPKPEFTDALQRIKAQREREQAARTLQALQEKPYGEWSDEEKQAYKSALTRTDSG